FSNQGTMRVNDGSIRLNGAWSNAGTITVSGGALYLGGDFSNASLGTINFQSGVVGITGNLDNTSLNPVGHPWTLAGGAINGGNVGGAGLILSSGALSGVTLSANCASDPAFYDVQVYDGLTLAGTLTTGGPGNLNFVGTQ